MRAVIAVVLFLNASSALASDMAGVGLAFSLPITSICLLISLIASLMSDTKLGYMLIGLCSGVSVLIALVMASYSWYDVSDKELYFIHLALTLLLLVPPVLLKIRLEKLLPTKCDDNERRYY